MSALLTVPEIAHMLRVDTTTVRRWIYDGLLTDLIGLPCKGDPRRRQWRIPRRSLATMLKIEESKLATMLEIEESKLSALPEEDHGENALPILSA